MGIDRGREEDVDSRVEDSASHRLQMTPMALWSCPSWRPWVLLSAASRSQVMATYSAVLCFPGQRPVLGAAVSLQQAGHQHLEEALEEGIGQRPTPSGGWWQILVKRVFTECQRESRSGKDEAWGHSIPAAGPNITWIMAGGIPLLTAPSVPSAFTATTSNDTGNDSCHCCFASSFSTCSRK